MRHGNLTARKTETPAIPGGRPPLRQRRPPSSLARWDAPWRTGLAIAVLWFGVLAGEPGCTKTFHGVACSQDSDCPTGQGCDEESNVCLPSCTTSEECPTDAHRCDRGLCVLVENPECTTASECLTPGACHSMESVSCREGTCVYSDVACDDPPASECVDDDSTIRTYVQTGTCSLQTGQCEYAYVDSTCADCAANCLGSNACDGVICADQNGGCKIQGVCVPPAPTSCAYQDAPPNTPCDRPGSTTGALDGYCNQGTCGDAVPVVCADNAECTPDTCIGGYCHPAAGLQETCDPGDDGDCGAGLACEGGVCVRTDGQACTDNAECLNTCIASTCAGASVAGGPCDAANGGDDDDCQPGLHCNSGTCETSLACTANSGCTGGDTCIGGYCRAPAATGGDCDAGDDADCQGGNTCASGVCLLVNGQACNSNDQCVKICVASTCADPSSTHGPCDAADGAADCQPGHLCPAGECLLVNGQSGCTSDGDCVETCIGGLCSSLSAAGGDCDSAGDCLAGSQCSGGHCLLVNGQVCSANADCLNVCVAGSCADPSATGGDCDTADGDADCQSGNQCASGHCLRVNGQVCSANTDCLNVCIAGSCADPSAAGGDCDTADGGGDCQSGMTCVSGSCLLLDGQSCSANSQCQHTCIGGTCGPLSGNGSPCDDVDDCQSGLVCVRGICQENGIVRIRILGDPVSGGGSLYAWHLVDADGTNQGTVSPNYPFPGTGLYGDIDWTAVLMGVIGADSDLVIAGSSGSAALTRTFTFFDGFGATIDTVVVDSANGSAWIERDFGNSVDWFVKFHYDGTHVTYKQAYPYIDSILVEGTSTMSGGGGGLSGYYEVDASGNNQGQLSSGTTQNLYSLSSWEVHLTRPVYGGMHFVLLGNESSSPITRTFTFKNASGGVVDTVTVPNLNSADIIRYYTWPSSDTFTMFTYQDGVVTGVQHAQ